MKHLDLRTIRVYSICHAGFLLHLGRFIFLRPLQPQTGSRGFYFTCCEILKRNLPNFGMDRSSHLQMFFKIGVFRYFAIFTRKHLCWSLFLIKRLKKRLYKETPNECFPVNIAKSLRTAFFDRPPPVAASASKLLLCFPQKVLGFILSLTLFSCGR